MLNRRNFLIKISNYSFFTLFIPAFVFSDEISEDGKLFDFEWQLPTAHIDNVKENLKFEGRIEKKKNQKGLGLIYVIVGVVALPYLSQAIIALIREIQYGGVVIDARSEKIIIQTDKSIPGGTIITIDKNKTSYYERNKINDISTLTGMLKDLVDIKSVLPKALK